MSLRDQQDPVVSVQEEKSKAKRVIQIKDDEVVRNLNDGTTWHISRDRLCTRIEVTQLCSEYVDEVIDLGEAHSQNKKKW